MSELQQYVAALIRRADHSVFDSERCPVSRVYLAADVDQALATYQAALRWILENGIVMAIHHIDGKPHPRLVDNGDYDGQVPPESCAKPIEAILATWRPVPPDLELQAFRERTIKHLQDTKVPVEPQHVCGLKAFDGDFNRCLACDALRRS